MAVPIFVSLPSNLTTQQGAIRDALYKRLDSLDLEPRTVGSPYDVALRDPLHEIRTVARHCSGGLILGFVKTYVEYITPDEHHSGISSRLSFPTPWNHLETGILFGLDLPILVFREIGITGGIFDIGSSDVFVHDMPSEEFIRPSSQDPRLAKILARWAALVLQHYYRD